MCTVEHGCISYSCRWTSEDGKALTRLGCRVRAAVCAHESFDCCVSCPTQSPCYLMAPESTSFSLKDALCGGGGYCVTRSTWHSAQWGRAVSQVMVSSNFVICRTQRSAPLELFTCVSWWCACLELGLFVAFNPRCHEPTLLACYCKHTLGGASTCRSYKPAAECMCIWIFTDQCTVSMGTARYVLQGSLSRAAFRCRTWFLLKPVHRLRNHVFVGSKNNSHFLVRSTKYILRRTVRRFASVLRLLACIPSLAGFELSFSLF